MNWTQVQVHTKKLSLFSNILPIYHNHTISDVSNNFSCKDDHWCFTTACGIPLLVHICESVTLMTPWFMSCHPSGSVQARRRDNGLLYCLLILIIIRTQKVNGYLDTWIADISIITKALFSLTWKIQFLTLQSNINDGQSKRYEDSVDVHAVLQCRRLCDILGTPYKSAHTTKSLYGKEIKSLLIQ